MPAVPFKVKAVFEYRSEEPDDLNFDNGQIITVTEEDDPDWYTGEYVNPAGAKLEGIFPRNFVEKYEPAIPSRPTRAPRRAPVQDAPTDSAQEPAPTPAPEPVPPPPELTEPSQAEEVEPLQEPPERLKDEPVSSPIVNKPAAAPSPTVVAKSPPPSAAKPPPPVAEKPTSSSFKDRIAAFNKGAAAPITPYKPPGTSSTSFIRKPFVAPPPSRNAYVPPPREPAVQKPYRREEDTSLSEPPEAQDTPDVVPARQEAEAEDQPKPQSLKDRIALLQKQQMEQAARNAEKKDKPKKPPKKRVEPTEYTDEGPPPESAATTSEAHEATVPPSDEIAEEEHEIVRAPPSRRTTGLAIVTPQPQPSRELVSDTNDADDSGAGDEEDVPEESTEEDRPKSKGVDQPTTEPPKQKAVGDEEEQDAEDDEGEDEDEDPEDRRRRELRERMAKMSGGMGMMGMFGPPGGVGASGAARKPKPSENSRQTSDSQPQEEQQERAAPIRIMALPGMSNPAPKRQDESVAGKVSDDDDDEGETAQPTPREPPPQSEQDDYMSKPPQRRSTDRPAPPLPHERAPPPAPPRETRAVPPPPPSANRAVPPPPQSPTARAMPPIPPTMHPAHAPAHNDESDDEGQLPGEYAQSKSPIADEFQASAPALPPPPPARMPESPSLDMNESPISPSHDKRASRLPPPIPSSPISAAPQTRAPPPPPPGFPPSRQSTSDSRGLGVPQYPRSDVSDEDEVTEYDGDYDTDIASSAKHKDALKSHNRDSSLDEDVLTDDAVKPPKSPPARAAPPLPPTGAPRDVPPPPPPQSAPRSRKSMDAPRAAPPPVPPPKQLEDDDYDPYRYTAPHHSAPSQPGRAQYSTTLQSPKEELEEDDMYGVTPQQTFVPPPPTERSAPPPPSSFERPEHPPPGTSPRQSLDVKRSTTVSRRSMDHSRGSGEQGFIAHDIDLGRNSLWWTQENALPPSLQGRPDVRYEMETSSSTKRGGNSTISKEVYVLYMDYSQTTINASFDATEPSHVALEQNHQRPPPAPRRDQLEQASGQYGAQIARSAASLLGTTVSDGSAQGLVMELLKPHSTALLPIGTRAYGALVYANLGNASTQQYDEIRAGDIVTFRNAKFAGHKGGLHAKYSVDVGKPEHVAVVIDWDGTKKKIRAWEQGRDLEKGKRSKVREESFKVGDLKSGEVMVWRVMPRTWVGWDSGKS